MMAPYCVREDTERTTVMSYMGDVEEGSTGSSAAEEEEEEVEQLAGVFPPPPNVLPESLSLENSLPQLLMSQCGVSEEYELVNQTNIRLRIISKDMSLQRLSIYMPSLVELDLTGSWLQSLRDLGCGLRLRILKVSRCGLDCLDGLFGLSTLTELHAQSNLITDIGSCAVLPRLQLLDLSRNRVETLGEISFLSICYQLSNLNLSYNPVSAYPEYREVVTTLLPGLHVLDGEILAIDEKNKEDIDDESTEISEKNSNQNGNLQKENIDEGSQDEAASRKSPSVVESENNRGSTGDSSKVKKRARPSTSIGFHPSIKATGRLERPHTAGPNKKPQNHIDEDVTSDFPDIDGTEESSTSLLTSGGIVCGNLTAALRSRTRNRNQRESWGHDQINQSSSPSSNFNNTTFINNSPITKNTLNESMENNNVIKPNIKGKEERAKEIESLLKASRNWRAAYSSYRETNREKWENDDDGNEEDEENCKKIN